jgi:hypothetical protein
MGRCLAELIWRFQTASWAGPGHRVQWLKNLHESG